MIMIMHIIINIIIINQHNNNNNNNIDNKKNNNIHNHNNNNIYYYYINISNHIQIIIEDNGIGRKASAKIKSEKSIKRKSIGINLTKDRLTNFSLTLKNKYSIIYQDLEDENKKATGTKVIIKIPLK